MHESTQDIEWVLPTDWLSDVFTDDQKERAFEAFTKKLCAEMIRTARKQFTFKIACILNPQDFGVFFLNQTNDSSELDFTVVADYRKKFMRRSKETGKRRKDNVEDYVDPPEIVFDTIAEMDVLDRHIFATDLAAVYLQQMNLAFHQYMDKLISEHEYVQLTETVPTLYHETCDHIHTLYEHVRQGTLRDYHERW